MLEGEFSSEDQFEDDGHDRHEGGRADTCKEGQGQPDEEAASVRLKMSEEAAIGG